MKCLFSKRNKLVIFSIIAILFTIVYFVFNPELGAYFPQCPLYKFTGFQCPGCGSQRAFHALLHFQLVRAFHFNALFVIGLPYLLGGIYFEYFGGNQKYPKARKILFGRKAIFVALLIALGFGLLRNIYHWG